MGPRRHNEGFVCLHSEEESSRKSIDHPFKIETVPSPNPGQLGRDSGCRSEGKFSDTRVMCLKFGEAEKRAVLDDQYRESLDV